MKIALIGYGKMGHEIEQIAIARNHEVTLIIDKDNQHDLNADKLKQVDIAIEFSTPHTAFQNIKTCLEFGVPIVVGTTGWLDKLDEAKRVAEENSSAIFYASNYSVGVNLYFRLNKVMAKYINAVKGYTTSIKEIHHTQKLDAPSGTAITLAQIVSDSIDELNGWTLLPERSDNKIPIESVREGTIPGTHVITFDSEQDEIVITHRIKNRKGLALGAVVAAEYLIGKRGFHTMDDLLVIE